MSYIRFGVFLDIKSYCPSKNKKCIPKIIDILSDHGYLLYSQPDVVGLIDCHERLFLYLGLNFYLILKN